MGLSCKQVSSDEVEWIQGQSLLQAPTMERPKASSMKRRHHQENQLQQLEPPLKCPRCDSSNTKFCYYNNYNKSQPRYFCKTCKRHWTKGGNLRNVPVGGGRKNKRHQTSAAASASKTTTTTIKSSTSSAIQPHQLPPADQKYIPNIKFHSPLQQNSVNCRNSEREIFSTNNGVCLDSTMSQGLQTLFPLPFPFSSSSSYSLETFPSSISASFQSSSLYNYSGETREDPTGSLTWKEPITSNGIEMANYWNWDDIDALVSTDLNIPWDDSEIKPWKDL
ncbi:dof zinc finger protein DOF1.4 [Gossypium raimondii]|uniref:Dof zinc finger protein n=1 Tax=Gossypium raimondii TaxID=29730 RepID=A0A0D2STD6_GOSRA|nr:dof zinc finger protein DOF1.4 [Gossypium raimondii]KJB66678.1 hypothetical protein B456_010G152100 [Gossypium raimondii]